MKNFYELSRADLSKYRKEFNKIDRIKNLLSEERLFFALCMVSVFVSGILEALIEEDGANFVELQSLSYGLSCFAFVIFGILYCIVKLSFIRWLKIKYNINY